MQDVVKNSYRVPRALIGQSQEDDTAVRLAALEHEFAKVLVLGHQDAAFTLGLRHDNGVLNPREILADPGHIMPLTA